DVEEGVPRVELDELEVRDRLARGRRVERLPGRVVTVTTDRSLDPARARTRTAHDEREIVPLDLAAPDQSLETPVRLGRARDHHAARGVAGEAGQDPRPVRLLAAPDRLAGQPVVVEHRRLGGSRMA